jgi:hypothetical protein
MLKNKPHTKSLSKQRESGRNFLQEVSPRFSLQELPAFSGIVIS